MSAPDAAPTPEAEAPAAGEPWRRLAPLAAWAAGLILVFGPGLASGFRHILGGLGDVRLINYTLEHGYRWLLRQPLHVDFWSPPIFYPHPGASAYTDVLLGVAPVYWLFRALGVEPDVAFHLWALVMWSLNFAAAWWLLRRCFRIGAPAAAGGAFLFAFGAWRQLNVIHQQLIPSFYLIVSLGALIAALRESERPGARRRRITLWIALFFAGLALQAWTAFYPLYFFCLALAAALLWALVLAAQRRRLLAHLRRHGAAWALGALLAAAAVYPLAARYAGAVDEVGLRRYPRAKVPRPMSWVLMGQTHRLYGRLQGRDGPFWELRTTNHSNGAGPVTTVVALAGLWTLRRRLSTRLLVLAVGTIVVVATTLPGDLSLWHLVHGYLPGAGALRAVGRIGMVLLVPLALGVAAFFDRRRRAWLAAALAAVCLLEQLHGIEWRDRDELRAHVAAIAAKIGPECDAFLLVSRGKKRYGYTDEDAAWAALATGVPTINGRYGNSPPAWGLEETHVQRPRRERRVRRKLARWIERHGLDPDRVCWIETRKLR